MKSTFYLSVGEKFYSQWVIVTLDYLISVNCKVYFKSMGKTQYTQKFRDEWLVDALFKDWLVKIELDRNKARCRFCKTEVVAKWYDLLQHTKTKKHIGCKWIRNLKVHGKLHETSFLKNK